MERPQCWLVALVLHCVAVYLTIRTILIKTYYSEIIYVLIMITCIIETEVFSIVSCQVLGDAHVVEGILCFTLIAVQSATYLVAFWVQNA